MEEKRYDVYSENKIIASDMTVEIAACLGVAICPTEEIESA